MSAVANFDLFLEKVIYMAIFLQVINKTTPDRAHPLTLIQSNAKSLPIIYCQLHNIKRIYLFQYKHLRFYFGDSDKSEKYNLPKR